MKYLVLYTNYTEIKNAVSLFRMDTKSFKCYFLPVICRLIIEVYLSNHISIIREAKFRLSANTSE